MTEIVIDSEAADAVRELCERIFELEHQSAQKHRIAGEYARLHDMPQHWQANLEAQTIEERCDELKVELSMYLIAEVEAEG